MKLILPVESQLSVNDLRKLKLLATLMGRGESLRTWSSLSFFLIDRIEILMACHSKVTHLQRHRNPSDYMFSQIPPLTPAWNLIFMVNSSSFSFAIHNTESRYIHPVILA